MPTEQRRVNIEAPWDNSQPIYRQLRDRVVAMILEGVLKEGDALPSVRTVAAEFRLNPLTVLKGYQQLVDEQLVEKRRGRGMYVSVGAAAALRTDERRRFLEHDWPKVRSTIARLGLDLQHLLQSPTPPTPGAAANKDSDDEHDR
jgi:GntR family transcriptional regulator